MNNHINYKVWDEIVYPFPNFNSATKFLVVVVGDMHWWVVLNIYVYMEWKYVKAMFETRKYVDSEILAALYNCIIYPLPCIFNQGMGLKFLSYI